MGKTLIAEPGVDETRTKGSHYCGGCGADRRNATTGGCDKPGCDPHRWRRAMNRFYRALSKGGANGSRLVVELTSIYNYVYASPEAFESFTRYVDEHGLPEWFHPYVSVLTEVAV